MSESLSDLLRCFSETSAEALRFMETRFGCRRAEWFSDGAGMEASPGVQDFSHVRGIFSYVVRYSDAESTLEISYGDRELLVEVRVAYPERNAIFHPVDLLAALGIDGVDERSFGDGLVQSVGHMRRVVRNLAVSVERYWPDVCRARAEVIERAFVLVENRMRGDRAELRRRDRDRACLQASEAFHAGNYVLAIELLAPYLNDPELSPARRKLHELALRYAQQTSA